MQDHPIQMLPIHFQPARILAYMERAYDSRIRDIAFTLQQILTDDGIPAMAECLTLALYQLNRNVLNRGEQQQFLDAQLATAALINATLPTDVQEPTQTIINQIQTTMQNWTQAEPFGSSVASHNTSEATADLTPTPPSESVPLFTPDEWLSIHAVAAQWQKSPTTVRRLLPHVQRRQVPIPGGGFRWELAVPDVVRIWGSPKNVPEGENITALEG